ncbi:MAG TPA: hypothetical protein PLO74_04320, partial [Thermotogota bacterium]|nr:hypothetical protein [Thermotogota bacterium]
MSLLPTCKRFVCRRQRRIATTILSWYDMNISLIVTGGNMNKDEAFEALTEHWKKRKILGNINALLHWDMEVNMPEKAIANRAESNALIGMESYREQTSPKIAEALEVLKTPEFYPSLTSNERRMIDLYAHETLKMKLIPPDLFETFIRLTSRAQKSWEKAKTASDFSIFESDLTELMSLIRA